MKKLFLPLAIVSTILFSCSGEHTHKNEAEEHGLEPLAYTMYTEKTELFVEFKPLVVGNESKFAAHLTILGEQFKPFTEGTITLTVTVNGKSVSTKSTEPSNPGIFRLALKPDMAGIGKLVFDIQTKEFIDKITIDSVKIYADEKTALSNQSEEHENSDISYLKEQAWKVEFANIILKKQSFSDIIKTSGQILPAPGDEMIVTAKASGIVLFSGNKTIIGSEISSGTNLFTISAGDFADGNIDSKFKEAKSNFENAKANYERHKELVRAT